MAERGFRASVDDAGNAVGEIGDEGFRARDWLRVAADEADRSFTGAENFCEFSADGATGAEDRRLHRVAH